jgi:hypothetical protein
MTVKLIQAVDDRNETIEILGFVPGGAQRLVANTTSANVSQGWDNSYRVFTIVADQPVVWNVDLGTAPAVNVNTANYLPASWLQEVKVRDKTTSDVAGNSYFSFQAVTIAANVYVMPRT